MRLGSLVFLALMLAPNLSAECVQPVHPCRDWAQSQSAWLGTVTRVVPGESDPELGPLTHEVQMRVDEVFFGTVEAGSRIEFTQIAFGETGVTPDTGARYVIYGKNSDGSGFGLDVCRGAVPLRWAEAHLTYARSLDGQVMKSSFRGRARSSAKPEYEGGLEGAYVTLSGPNGQLETTSDANGLFALEGIPPGQYRLDAAYPAHQMRWYGERTVRIPAKGCDYADVVFAPANGFAGRILDRSGQPLSGLWVEAISLPPLDPDEVAAGFAETDAQGRFVIQGLTPGQYRLGVNIGHGPRETSPYPATFYPGTETWQEAAVFALGDTRVFESLDFMVGAPLENRSVRVRVVDKGGRPAANVRVAVFDPRYHDQAFSHVAARTQTDENGVASLTAYIGPSYVVEAWRYQENGDIECSQTVPLDEAAEYDLVLRLDKERCLQQWKAQKTGPYATDLARSVGDRQE